jgi:hypothetical protein
MKTSKYRHTLFLCILASILNIFLLIGSVKAAEPQHLFWASDIAINVTPELNTYGSYPSYVRWPKLGGIRLHENRTRCSTFLTLVLMKGYGLTSTDIINWMSTASPSANTYHETIKQKNGFKIVYNINNIIPGDIIAIKYPNGITSTGHVMIAKTKAVPRTATSPFVSETSQYEIQVIDSSQSPHGSSDSRSNGDGTYDSGAGIGVLRLYANSLGGLAGYTWSTQSNSQFFSKAIRPIIVGRLI